jgi:tRNA pseudouridine55 synthase
LSRRRKGDAVNGVVLLDKPAGLSSNQALQRVRRLFNARKAGHTGTLDPFATGLLPLCFGEASKTTAFLLDATKAYRAEARLGQATATGDPEGDVVETGPVPSIDADAVEKVLAGLTGDIEQVPPMYSALKHEGRPLYELARKGITVPRKARPVTIHALDLVDWKPPRLVFDVVCSKGTYIRTLAEDIAAELGTVAHLTSLRRQRVGPFEAEGMVTLEALEAAAEAGRLHDHLLPVDAGLPDWPIVMLDDAGEQAFVHGNPASLSDDQALSDGTLVRVYGAASGVLGLGEWTGRELQPRKVFQLHN